METNKILTSNVLDIIFDGKNKLYGAYDLRNTYNNRLSKALFVTSSLALIIFAGTVFASSGGEDVPFISVVDTEIRSVSDVTPTPPIVPKSVPKEKINQKQFTEPIIVIDKAVTKEEILTELKENDAISSVTVKSDILDRIGIEPVVEIQTKVFEKPMSNNEDSVFRAVEIEAEFPGGVVQWTRYLQKNLNPDAPVDNNAPGGTYRVTVQFIVSKDGSISDVQAQTKYGYGMEEEAMKIIKRGPKWKPGLQNGRPVNAYRSQPIIFVVEN